MLETHIWNCMVFKVSTGFPNRSAHNKSKTQHPRLQHPETTRVNRQAGTMNRHSQNQAGRKKNKKTGPYVKRLHKGNADERDRERGTGVKLDGKSQTTSLVGELGNWWAETTGTVHGLEGFDGFRRCVSAGSTLHTHLPGVYPNYKIMKLFELWNYFWETLGWFLSNECDYFFNLQYVAVNTNTWISISMSMMLIDAPLTTIPLSKICRYNGLNSSIHILLSPILAAPSVKGKSVDCLTIKWIPSKHSCNELNLSLSL